VTGFRFKRLTGIWHWPSQRDQSGKRYSYGRRISFIVILIIIWEGLFRLGIWPEFLFPSPSQVIETLLQGFLKGTYPIGIAVSIRRIALGYGFSLVVGITLGLLLGRVRLLDETIGSLALGLQTLPSICWLPLALLWFGLNERAILFVVIMGALLSITLATQDGVKNTPRLYLHAARNLGANGWKLYAYVILPAALPSIVTGMKLGWSFAWRSLMAAELLYVSLGLGHLLMMGRELNDMSQVIAVMLVIITIGLVIDRLVFVPLQNRIRERWGLASN
jgi:NitT/TauT family transport system permease protein